MFSFFQPPPLCDLRGCRGSMTWDWKGAAQSTDVAFSLYVDAAGEIQVNAFDFPHAQEHPLLPLFCSDSAITTAIRLSGTAPQGEHLQSNSVWLTHIPPPPAIPVARARASTVRMESPTRPSVAAELIFRALLPIFGATEEVAFESGCGTTVVGRTKYDAIIEIASVSPGPDQFDNWYLERERHASAVLDVISFANGCRYKLKSMQAASGASIVRNDFLGVPPQVPAHKPPLSFDHYRCCLGALTSRYQERASTTGLNVAIEWHLFGHLYNEARFIGQCIALEHLVFRFAESFPASTYLSKSQFKSSVEPDLSATIRARCDAIGATESARDGLLRGVGNINRKSFRANLFGMFEQYKIPFRDLEHRIVPLIDKRNQVIHSGLSVADPSDTSLLANTAVAEELFRRVFLTHVGYQGVYKSWLDRIAERDFPSLE